MRLFIPLLVTMISLNVGCNQSTDPSTSDHTSAETNNDTKAAKEKKEAPAEHPAITVANQVLAAIQAEDAEAIRPLLNATNQKKISDDEIGGFLKEAKYFIGDATKVSEVRESSRDGQWMAKIRVVGKEVVLLPDCRR